MRTFDGTGGVIHCITKEIPAENPLRIKHYPYRFSQIHQDLFTVDAEIYNKSGISEATLYWKKIAENNWIEVPLINEIEDHWIANIPADLTTDTLQYYISATSNNGKTMNKPFPGEEGPYTFWYGTDAMTSVNEISNAHHLGSLYPNPTTSETILEFNHKAEQIRLIITDAKGSEVQNDLISNPNSKISIQTTHLDPGVYYLSVIDTKTETLLGNRKLVRR